MDLNEIGMRAVMAERKLRIISPEKKTEGLLNIATALRADQEKILQANDIDMALAKENGMSISMQDRLKLTPDRIEGMAKAVEDVAAWPDPVGRVIQEYDRPNGLHVKRVNVPLGVIGIIFESRPNVASDCASLCVRAGNTVILRGGHEAINSNIATTGVMRRALAEAGLPEDSIQLITDTSHETANKMMNLTEYLDVLIPRGGAELINRVVRNASVPVIQTGAGNVHIYVDKAADIEMAADIVENAKTQRPSVCNAAEKLLVHKDIADKALPVIAKRLYDKNVELRGDDEARKIIPEMNEATADDWGREYIDLIMGVKIVDSVEEAVDHIERYSTHHSDCIVTEDEEAAKYFLDNVDSAAVYWNASTRFTDGGQLGLGSEIGISTQKLHARGPMGVDQLVTYKFVITGQGQVRA
ncbi:MAG: glutamate-5-semialdehyde dehydrogenase [Eubacteriales bacterium]|nr:glutamate-5-semialdehyde dehydrogenase [Eubacteriales bacterium]